MSLGLNIRVRERRFVCGVLNCHQKFVSASAVARHVARAHQTDKSRPEKDKRSGTFMCEHCSKTFNQSGKLNVHLRIHRCSSAKNFRCTEGECQKMFFSREGLRRHKLTHLGIKLYECDECGIRCSSNVALKEHCARHADLRPYTCNICARSFRQISCFQRHLQTHSGERRYQCLVCQHTFSQAAYLKSHMKKHTGESPYKCSICQKCFKHASDVKRHMSVHSDEKRYSCNVCLARFKDSSSCRRHVREHATGKTHVCSVCSKPFKRVAQLNSHLQQKHGAQAAASSVLTAAGNISNAAKTFDSLDLTSSKCMDAIYYTSSLAAVYDVGPQLQSCDMIVEEGDCSIRQCEILPVGYHSSETKAASVDTTTASAASEAYDNNSFSVCDKSSTVMAQSLGYVHNSCSESESDRLFSQECSDSLPLPIPSLTEDSISDVIATSQAAGFTTVHDSSFPSFSRPDVTDATYLPWHVRFADAMCSASVPLPEHQLQAVVSVWSSLVSDMTAMVTDDSMSEWQQHYPALLDVVHKLGAVVESHLQILQPTGTTECSE